ncbi:histidine kinase [Erythrobacter sp. SG61-1L]|uniref:HAMP domain-containing sensor histidine kinase n=1 Tax=Erythrobacter sp. SG61-1L TaxID=1603897 RepID=UPI0006C8E684|nr:HAMP domain-containing sensor histidine kinase [Erythrobacter sp. SG61-1L]KPL68741.1 histidine kinase [Erythrobacter sp. SG61-1L]
MIERLRALARRFWPVMRLRWVLFGTLLFVAALPGFAALGLRVYENALVRRTEAEVTAQAASIAAMAALLWPGASAASAPPVQAQSGATYGERYELSPTEIDLRSSPVLPSRPPALPASGPPDLEAQALAARLAPALAEIKRTTLASIVLLDRNGIVLNGREAGRSLAALPELRVALSGRPVTVLRHNDAYSRSSPLEWVSRATSIRLHQARPIMVGGKPVGAVLVSRSPAALFRGMWEDAGKIAAGTLAIFLLLIALTSILARAIVRPVEKLSEAARSLASGAQVEPRRPTLEVREIRSLYDDFEAMAASIARRSRYLRDFAASLSHEFKTPLAGLRGGIELLQDHGGSMTGQERERFLANMAGDADRLSRLVSRLMELAQADMRGGDVQEPASLAPILARLADGLAGASFAVTVDVPPDMPPLAMEGAALETVLTTLIENARQAGASHLSISAKASGGEGVVVLQDDGPGIPVADRERIFDPFFTSRRGEGGTGLGLPIARALVQNSRGSLELAEGGQGACFVLRIPVWAEPF